MEELLNAFGWAAWGPVLAIAAPLAVVGLIVRAAARRRALAIALTMAARRRLGDVTSGAVTLEGIWRAPRGNGDGLVEDEGGAAVLVTCDEGAEAIADGARVLVVGCAVGDGDDPRGSGYRGHARLPRVLACGIGHFVQTYHDGDGALLRREERQARRRATVGAALFAAAVALAASAALVAWRAVD